MGGGGSPLPSHTGYGRASPPRWRRAMRLLPGPIPKGRAKESGSPRPSLPRGLWQKRKKKGGGGHDSEGLILRRKAAAAEPAAPRLTLTAGRGGASPLTLRFPSLNRNPLASALKRKDPTHTHTHTYTPTHTLKRGARPARGAHSPPSSGGAAGQPPKPNLSLARLSRRSRSPCQAGEAAAALTAGTALAARALASGRRRPHAIGRAGCPASGRSRPSLSGA